MAAPHPLRKFDDFGHDVIVIDGLWGSGKQLVSTLIGTFERVEHYKYDPDYDYFCALDALGHMSRAAAITMLQLVAGRNQYYNVIGREINLRWHDETGWRYHPRRLEWVRRIFGPDGDEMAERIDRLNIANNLATHCILAAADPLHDAFGSRLKFVEVTRHPVHLYTHWKRFLAPSKWRRTREFNLTVDVHGEKVPWFAAGWAETFAQASVEDRALLGVSRLATGVMDRVETRHRTATAAHLVSFESLVLEPSREIERLRSFLGRPITGSSRRIMRMNAIPRARIADGPRIGQSYRWTSSGSDAEVYRRLADEIDAEVSAPVRDEFWAVVERYNRVFPGPLAAYE
jgi:hypothetical protein